MFLEPVYMKEQEGIPGQTNTRTRPSDFVILTSWLAESLREAVCAVVSHGIPENYRTFVRQTQLTHTESFSNGEKLKVGL
jgi:predicted thioesterase